MSSSGRTRLPAILLCFALFGLYAWIASSVFGGFPYSMDENSYLYQAKLFASFKLGLPTTDHLAPLAETYMQVAHGQLFSKYPPGHALLLTLGVWLGHPEWVNPFLASLFLLFTTLWSQTWIDRRMALLGMLIVGTNSYYIGYAASFFSQCSICFFLGMTFLLFQSLLKNLTWFRGIAYGFLFSFSILIRPLDTLCLWMAVGLFLTQAIRSGCRYRTLMMCHLAAPIPGVIALYSYNYLQTGIWALTTYPIWDGEFKVDYFSQFPDRPFIDSLELWLGDYSYGIIRYVGTNYFQFFLPLLAPLLPLIILGALQRRDFGLRFVGLTTSVLLVFLYNFHTAMGWPQYGARYWYPAWILLAPLTLGGLQVFSWITSHRKFTLTVCLILLIQLGQGFYYFTDYAKRFSLLKSVTAEFEKLCPEKSIVVVQFPNQLYLKLDHLINHWDIIRNPFQNQSRLYVHRYDEALLVQKDRPEFSVCKKSLLNFAEDLRPVQIPRKIPLR